MSKYLIVLSISVLLCIITIESCETPNGQPGLCIELKDCPVLMKRFLQNRYDPYLKKFACGHSNSDVCCPSDTKVTTTSTAGNLPIPEPTDMSSIKYHRNIGLINNKSCGPDITNKMYDGNKAKLFQYKWNVLLQFKSTGALVDEQFKFICGGSLIADQYVLSAASCVTDARKSGYELFSVRLGEHDQSTENDCIGDINPDNQACAPPVQDIKVEKYKLHKMYNGALSVNDIMMIKLEHPVEYTRNIKTICLPTNENELITNTVDLEQLTSTGWGNREHNSYSDILLFANMHFVSLNTCMISMKKSGIETQLYPSHLCAKIVDLKDSCIVNKGGPLVGGIDTKNEHGGAKIKNFQFGIFSDGVGCRNQDVSPGIYTNVAYYMNWILNQMDY